MNKKYAINKFISLRLEGKETNIYLGGKKFKQCNKILLSVPLNDAENYDSIDELIYKDNVGISSNEVFLLPQGRSNFQKLEPFEEFWAHCSNLQAWVEMNYDTRFLNFMLSFPILKRLAELGDDTAIKVFKDEIAKRFSTGYPPVVKYLVLEGYLDYLNNEETRTLVQNIEKLELSGISLDSIPKFVFKAKKLKELYLNENCITEIGHEIGLIKELKTFDARYNLIQKISENIGCLTKLTYLNLEKNKVKIIPESIGNLLSLQELYISLNLVDKLPSSIGTLKNLRRLDVSRNRISDLPDNISSLLNLEYLDISENQFHYFPELIGKLTSLNSLNISNNNIKIVPNIINLPEKLVNLDFSNNFLEEIPVCIANLNNLEILYLIFNGIKIIPEFLKNLRSLKELAIFGNPLEEIPELIIELPNLRDIILDKTQIALIDSNLLKELETKNIRVLIQEI